MEAIILCAGYATRLYPLTKNTPKPLLRVGNASILGHIIAKLEGISEIRKINVVSNNHFYKNFAEWLENCRVSKRIEIINDGTASDEKRLGAVGDMLHAIKAKNISDDLIVVAGDNLFEFQIHEALEIYKRHKSNVVVLHDVKDKKLARHYGVANINNDNILIGFKEKPLNPRSTLVSTGIYIFPKKTIARIESYVNEGNSPDKTGNFLEWLHKKEPVRAFITDKPWFDIGSHEQLERAREHYGKPDFEDAMRIRKLDG